VCFSLTTEMISCKRFCFTIFLLFSPQFDAESRRFRL
jgi:hypothetical protein